MTKVKSRFDPEVYKRNAAIYKIMANPKRLEILNLLKDRSCSFVDIVETLSLPKANVSQHLAILRHFRLVTAERKGQSVYHQLTKPQLIEACRMLKEVWEYSANI